MDLANTLAVTVFDVDFVAVQRRDYAGIHVDRKVDPAGVKARAAYEEWQKHQEESEQIKGPSGIKRSVSIIARSEFVVPFAMERVAEQVDGIPLAVGDHDPLGVG
ncbi:MAG TPA: hypothetical protein VGH36_06650, partial [Acetobacteraceae bacterium]